MKRLSIVTIPLLVLLLSVLVYGGAVQAGDGDSNFTNVVASGDIRAGDDIIASGDVVVAGDVVVSDDAAVTGNVTANGSLTSFGNVTVGSYLVAVKQTNLTVTNGAVFTPTGTLQGLTSAGSVTPTIAIPSTGKTLVLVNLGSNTINLADTGTLKLSAAFAMGTGDTLTLISDGTNLYELARSDN